MRKKCACLVAIAFTCIVSVTAASQVKAEESHKEDAAQMHEDSEIISDSWKMQVTELHKEDSVVIENVAQITDLMSDEELSLLADNLKSFLQEKGITSRIINLPRDSIMRDNENIEMICKFTDTSGQHSISVKYSTDGFFFELLENEEL